MSSQLTGLTIGKIYKLKQRNQRKKGNYYFFSTSKLDKTFTVDEADMVYIDRWKRLHSEEQAIVYLGLESIFIISSTMNVPCEYKMLKFLFPDGQIGLNYDTDLIQDDLVEI